MASHSPWYRRLVGAVAVCIFASLAPYILRLRHTTPKATIDASYPRFNASGQSNACIALATALPGSVYSDHHPGFHDSISSYWSLNACELKPTCVIRPASVQEAATVVKVLKSEFDATTTSAKPLEFAIRSGGHSPEAGFANVDGGVVVDMGLISEVTMSEDKRAVVIGAGARWSDVSSKLDLMDLAVVGGRSSHVGVGGLVLGGPSASHEANDREGGISFFSPRYGMVCDNVDGYEIILANGTVTTVTSVKHEDLWRALKGGTGNFGIVTRITAKTFPAHKIWAGHAYWGGWQTSKVLEAFVDFNKPESFDEYASGPILALAYIQKLGVRATVCHLAYTKPEKWPRVFKGFHSIRRLWDGTKLRSLTDATNQLAAMAPSSLRQFQATTTVRNDLHTFNEFNDVFSKKLEEVKSVKGSLWSIVLQPLSTAVMHKGSPNVLGLDTRQSNATLVIVLLSVSWHDADDDELVHRVSRDIIAIYDEIAQSRGTADPYRYLNYAASGQDPLGSYGVTNKQFMQAVSKTYDPDGFFQRAKQGGFKLNMF